ncbi:hypothetical protein AAFF_G00023350 [Aldrovandia affinis]|uniref:Uncharacterized protein n=1 Tax=Aldrovandia affinis TaxID=143900 RepID=A0AAD7T5J2_9TELE|nr:hypothetical protein AAFF_G00023350 [Aldrovandia affinis]
MRTMSSRSRSVYRPFTTSCAQPFSMPPGLDPCPGRACIGGRHNTQTRARAALLPKRLYTATAPPKLQGGMNQNSAPIPLGSSPRQPGALPCRGPTKATRKEGLIRASVRGKKHATSHLK